MTDEIVDQYVEVTKNWRLFGETHGFDADDDNYIDQLDALWYSMTEDQQKEAGELARQAVPKSVYIHKYG